jgi:hypothetical protein
MVWADSDKESDASKAKFGNWEIEFARVVLGRPLPDDFGSALLSRSRVLPAKKLCTLCVTFPVLSLNLPWIDDVNAAVLKVFRVARSKACSSRTSHGDNHGIELADGFPIPP